jgi:CRISPR type IV-associated protein Csf1
LTISNFIVKSIEKDNYNNESVKNENLCCICGSEYSYKWSTRKSIFSGSFTDQNMLKVKNSNYICGDCEKLLSDYYMKSPKDNDCGIRLYSFISTTSDFQIIDRSKREYYLFDFEYTGAFILVFSDTGQKHISWKSKISFNTNSFFVCNESGNIFFEREKYRKIYNIVKKLYNKGVSKDELKDCNVNISKINKYMISFDDLIEIKKYKNNNCYNLIVDCLQKEKTND